MTLASNQPADGVPERLVLTGALTVRTVRQVHADMLAAVRRNRHVRIDCSAASEIDLSFIQLVLAARRDAAATGGALALAHPADGALLERLR